MISLSIYDLMRLFTEHWQTMCLYDTAHDTDYYVGTFGNYDGPDWAIQSIDCLDPDRVDEEGNPIIVLNIDTENDNI